MTGPGLCNACFPKESSVRGRHVTSALLIREPRSFCVRYAQNGFGVSLLVLLIPH